VQQHELRPSPGSTKARKRVGRGNASGHGTYSTRGIKGQQARAGSGPRPGFEGGQTPLIRRLPVRRGFRNPFRVEYSPVNLRDLAKFSAGSEVTPESLRETGIVRNLKRPIKLLGTGEVTAALTVRAHRVSAAARVKIEAAGGSVEELTPREKKVRQRKHLRDAAAKAAQVTSSEAASEEKNDSGSESSESASAE
jgi:large subunit ribosomal protein L15